MRLLLLSLALTFLAQRPAAATCGCKAKVAPEPGAVPVRGSVFVEPRLVAEGFIKVRWFGDAGTSSWVVGKDVARLDYSGPEGSELVVMIGEHERAHYKLTSAWRPPSVPPRAIDLDHHESSWRCASTDALFIHLDQPTAAVRIRWTHAGKTTTWLDPVDGHVALGHNSCCGENIDPEELHEGGEFELIAIRVDGSEARVQGLPKFVFADVYTLSTSFSNNGEPVPSDPALPSWLRFVISIALIGAAAVIARRLSARLF